MSTLLQQCPTRARVNIPIERLPVVLRVFRLNRGLSRLHAARAAGLHLGSLLYLESRVEGVRVSPLSQFLCALGYSLTELQAALDRPLDPEWSEAEEPPPGDGRRRFPQAGRHLFPLALLGPALAELRIATGHNQLSLARVSGISHAQLSFYEVGRGAPRVVTLCRILDHLGSNLAHLQGVIDGLRSTLHRPLHASRL